VVEILKTMELKKKNSQKIKESMIKVEPKQTLIDMNEDFLKALNKDLLNEDDPPLICTSKSVIFRPWAA
jgi:hypothetical protein